jgi:dihydrofolate reductase
MWVACGVIVSSDRAVRSRRLEDPMATIVSTLFISLDGVVEIDPAWHFPYFDEHMGAAVGEDYEDVDLLLLGRVTYDSFAGAWPGREAAGGEDATFAAQLGDMRKVVATRGSQDLGWRNVEAVRGELVEAVTALKSEPGIGKILVAGSISVVRQLLAAGLLDELRLLVHPVAARRGERLFDEGDPIYPLRLLRSDIFPTGVVRLVYAPSEVPGTASYDDVTDKVPGAGQD